jgi:hypothetical protein
MIVVTGTSLALGGITSLAQGILPDALRPLANSSSGWTLLTATMTWAIRGSTVLSALLGPVSFVCLVAGYALVAELRGFAYGGTLWIVIGLVVGPFVGVAASWLHHDNWRAALGSGLLAGVAVGECIYGLTTIADTTGWFYWTLIGTLGTALLLAMTIFRLRRTQTTIIAVAVTFAVTATFLGVYNKL